MDFRAGHDPQLLPKAILRIELAGQAGLLLKRQEPPQAFAGHRTTQLPPPFTPPRPLCGPDRRRRLWRKCGLNNAAPGATTRAEPR